MTPSIQERAARVHSTKRKRTNMLCQRIDHHVAMTEQSGRQAAVRKKLVRTAEVKRGKLRNIDHQLTTEQTAKTHPNPGEMQELSDLLTALNAQIGRFRVLVKNLESMTAPAAESSAEMRYAFNIV